MFALSWATKRWSTLQEGGPDDDEQAAGRKPQGGALGMPIRRHFHSAVVWPAPDGEESQSGKGKKSKKDKGKGKAKEEEEAEAAHEEAGGKRGGVNRAAKMYVFGGKSNGYLNDLWEYDPRTPSLALRGILLLLAQLIASSMYSDEHLGRDQAQGR